MSTPIRLIHLLSNFETGGAEANTARLSAALAKRGFEQLIVSLSASINPGLAASLAVPLVHPRETGHLPATAPFLLRTVRRFAPDIIHGRAFRTWPEAVLVKALCTSPIRLLQSFHGTTSFALQHRRRRLLAGCLRRLTDGFVAVSGDVAARLAEQWHIPADAIRIIPNGVDTAFFSPAADRVRAKARMGFTGQTWVVGTVGSLREVKNHRLLISAFARICREDCNARLMIVGEGPLQSALQAWVARLGVADRVRFCGHQQCVRAHLQSMDLFVQPSHREGSPTAVLEAMACGIPVVATRSSGCVELHQRTGLPLLVDARDARALARLMMDLAGDGQRCAALARQARQTVSASFSLERMVDAYEAVYRALAIRKIAQEVRTA